MPFWDWRKSDPAPAPAPATASTLAAAPAPAVATVVATPAPPPGTPREKVPPVPQDFPQLRTLSDTEVQHLQTGQQLLDDFLLDLDPMVKRLLDRSKEVREGHCQIARKIMERSAEFEQLEARVAQSAQAMRQRRAPFEAIVRRREEVLSRRSPAVLGRRLQDEAHAIEMQAEDALQDALSRPGPLEGAALAQLKSGFLEKKAAKHRHLALKEALEHGRR